METFDTIMNSDKPEFYRLLQLQLQALISDEQDSLANLCNSSALLYQQLSQINWLGFYLFKGDQLVLGPFQGRTACVRISLGQGVCGTAAVEKKTLVVPDVHQFPGHIACDAASRSEIVIPLLDGNSLLGVLDIDSPITNRFDHHDQQGLELFCHFLVSAIDWALMP